MVISDRTKGCCSSDLNEPPHPNLTITNLLNLTHTTNLFLSSPTHDTSAWAKRLGSARWNRSQMLRDGVLRNLVSRGDLPPSAASDSWRSLRYARVPPVDYRDKPPSNETGSGFNRRNREWRLTLERRFGRCRRAGCRPRRRATAPRGQQGGHGCSASTATAAIAAGRGPRRRPRRRSGRGKSRGC